MFAEDDLLVDPFAIHGSIHAHNRFTSLAELDSIRGGSCEVESRGWGKTGRGNIVLTPLRRTTFSRAWAGGTPVKHRYHYHLQAGVSVTLIQFAIFLGSTTVYRSSYDLAGSDIAASEVEM